MFKFLKTIMAFKHENTTDKIDNSYQLTKSEIEIILNILKEGSFPVKNIEELYKALIKLQEQHKKLNR